MNENYLNIFSDMFFDINTNDDIKNILAQASELFATLIYKLGEVSNELDFCMDVSKDNSNLHLVITLFVRKLMEQIDAINILYSYGSVSEAELVLRSMFETVVALKFILQKDDTDREETRFRAAAYYMGYFYSEMGIEKKHMQSGGMIAGMSDADKHKWDRKKTAFSNMILRNAVFKRVDDERNKLKKPEKSRWYETAGVHSIREMMAVVGMDKYYEGLYGPISFETHALNITTTMSVKDDVLYTDRIRSPHNGANTFGLVCSFATMALKDLYKYLDDGDEEKLEFARFYKSFIAKQEIVEKNLGKIVR